MNATQLEFKAARAGESQCDKIAARLLQAPGNWVAMTDLWAVSGAFAVHSRIADLRRRGMNIEQRNERQPDGTIHSYYRIIINDAVPINAELIPA